MHPDLFGRTGKGKATMSVGELQAKISVDSSELDRAIAQMKELNKLVDAVARVRFELLVTALLSFAMGFAFALSVIRSYTPFW